MEQSSDSFAIVFSGLKQCDLDQSGDPFPVNTAKCVQRLLSPLLSVYKVSSFFFFSVSRVPCAAVKCAFVFRPLRCRCSGLEDSNERPLFPADG
jgi:hypothetical protein